MAVVAGTCFGCDRPCEVQVGQGLNLDRVVWHRAYRCEHCGHMSEEDGWGELPKGAREALLLQEGEWALEVPACSRQDKVEAVLVLRARLGFPLSEAVRYLEKLPGRVVEGTRAEMALLLKDLVAHGLVVELRRVR